MRLGRPLFRLPLAALFLGAVACARHIPAPGFVVFARADLKHNVVGVDGARLLGIDLVSGNYAQSDDLGASWTDTHANAQTVTPRVQQLYSATRWKFATTSDGRIFRTSPENWLSWVDVSVPRSSPPNLPPGTTGRPDILAVVDHHLFYGTYNANVTEGAHVYRSADDGGSWEEVLSVPQPRARHVHAIRADPVDSTRIFATLGDGNPESGLYLSAAGGAPGTFQLLSSNYFGINFAFPDPAKSLFILMEGDGPYSPFILGYDRTLFYTPSPTEAVATPPSSTWKGTSRGISMTAAGDVFWIATDERGATGTHQALWMAPGPDFSVPVLLLDFSAEERAKWSYLGKTWSIDHFLFNYRYRLYVSGVVSDCAKVPALAWADSSICVPAVRP